MKNTIQLRLRTLTILLFGCIMNTSLAQKSNYQFKVNKSQEAEYFLYYTTEKLNKFKTVYTSAFELDEDAKLLRHKRGTSLDVKKPWKQLEFLLNDYECDSLLRYLSVKRLPPQSEHYYKSLRFRPVNTLYLVTPQHDLFIQWEGPNPPRKKIVRKLMQVYERLEHFVRARE